MAASVPAKTTLPVLSNILRRSHQGRHPALGHRPRYRGRAPTVPAQVDQEGAITLPAQEAGRDRPRAAQRRDPVHRLRRAAGDRSNAAGPSSGCSGCHARSSPPFRPSSSTAAGERPAKDLQKLIAHVAFAASTEESRPILNGVLWELRPDRMRMVATNGHRLARMDVPRRRRQRGSGRSHRAAQGAGADPPALRCRRRDRDRPQRESPRVPLGDAPRSTPG